MNFQIFLCICNKWVQHYAYTCHRVTRVASTSTLCVNLPAQVYTALQSPQCPGEWLVSGKTVTVKRDVGGRAPEGITGQRYWTREGWADTWGDTGVELGAGQENHTAGGYVSECGGFFGRLQRGGRSDGKLEVIRFGSYNIQNGHNVSLKSALCSTYQANIYMGILQENKVNGSVTRCFGEGFPWWQWMRQSSTVRGLRYFTEIHSTLWWRRFIFMAKKLLASIWRREGAHWHVIRWYPAPYKTSTLERIKTDIHKRPRDADLLIARDFNADLASLEVQ